MSAAKFAQLPDRGVVTVTGADATKLLQGLVTNDLSKATADSAMLAGLLSPQGKILFEFLLAPVAAGWLIDIARDKAAELIKRLTLYKLRADVSISDMSADRNVFAIWDGDGEAPACAFRDTRISGLGYRLIAKAGDAAEIGANTNTVAATENDYHAHRIALGVPEGGRDYDFGDAYPHDADFDLFNGVSFTKGCFVGQEVVARMQNKSIIRKRIVSISATQPLTTGADILAGENPIGRIGSVDKKRGLAVIRLDRTVEAIEKGRPLTASGVLIAVEDTALTRFRNAVAQAAALGPAK